MKVLRVTMPDGCPWDVPVEIIARNRAAFYADEFGGDIERSLKEDTLPLFEHRPYQIEDWAAGNMDWSDVEAHAKRALRAAQKINYQEGWVNGEKEVLEIPD